MLKRKKYVDALSLEAILSHAGMRVSTASTEENAVLFVGTNGSGKSTLINYLIGNPLVGQDVKGQVNLYKADHSHGPTIGVPADYENPIPTRYASQRLPGHALWDTYSYADEREYEEDICNAYCITEIFKTVKSAKIVIVLQQEALLDDPTFALDTTLRGVEQLLGEHLREHFNSIALVMTKVDKVYGSPVSKEELIHFLRIKTGYEDHNVATDISVTVQNLVAYLISNPTKVCVFKRGTLEPFTDDMAGGILDVITSLEPIPNATLRDISPIVSDSAMLSLLDVYQELMHVHDFNELKDFSVKILDERLEDAENRRDKPKTIDELFDFAVEMCFMRECIDRAVDNTLNFYKKIIALKSTDVMIEFHIDERKLCQKARYMEFVDKQLSLKESENFKISLENRLFQVRERVKELISWIKSKIIKECKKLVNPNIVCQNC